MPRLVLSLGLIVGLVSIHGLPSVAQVPTPAWPRHAIDDSLRGADGVKLADANGDGLLDIVTGWEESGTTKAYFHPGFSLVKRPWPSVVVGPSPATEDAVWVDLNRDGQLDVLSCCEGNEQSLRAHFAPAPGDLLVSSAWRTEVVPASQQATRWMFAVPMPRADAEVGAKARNDSAPMRIVVGSKAPRGMIGLLEVTTVDPSQWKIQRLVDAAWIMSIELLDIDADGDLDILYSDRKPPASGVYWLENPGPTPTDDPATWPRHAVGAADQEVMFIAYRRSPTQNLPPEIYVGAKPNVIFGFRPGQANDLTQPWPATKILVEPTARIGRTKGLAVGDLDGDGQHELVFSCESATPPKAGVVWLRSTDNGTWEMGDISGAAGIKFDLIELVDMDGDGDLDVLTCEERAENRGLGVIWYENPHTKSPDAPRR